MAGSGVAHNQVVGDLEQGSHGIVNFNIVQTKMVDQFPIFRDGFQYTDPTWESDWANRTPHTCPGIQACFDYNRFISDNDIVSQINAGAFDEVWIYADPMASMWESTMAGDGSYWLNSNPVPSVSSSKAFVIMGWNFERGVGEAIHSYGHRVENIMCHMYGTPPGDSCVDPAQGTNWGKFATTDYKSPGNGGVGFVHCPVNGCESIDYDYNNQTYVTSNADDWYNYPNFTGETRLVNATDWSPNASDPQREYLDWWYSHMPHAPGRNPDGLLNDWWHYIINVDQYKFGDPLPDTTTRVSLTSSGGEAAGASSRPRISADGRYAVFASTAGNLVPGDTNGVSDIFLRDIEAGTTKRVSVTASGSQANGGSSSPFISADGTMVAFASTATNLVTGDTNGVSDVFAKALSTGAIVRVSRGGSGQANGASSSPSMSSDGRYVSYASSATNLVSGDSNGVADVFVRDRTAHATKRVSVTASGSQANGGSSSPFISADGTMVAFASTATNLVTGDTNGVSDVFAKALSTGAIVRVSRGGSGQANGASSSPSMSSDGRYVSYASSATNLVSGDSNGVADVFRRGPLS